MRKFLYTWLVAMAMGCIWTYHWARIELVPDPPRVASRWAIESLQRLPAGRSVDAAPREAKQYRAAGPIFVTAWWQGKAHATYQADSLVRAVQGAAERFARDPSLTALAGWSPVATNPVLFTVSVTRGFGPLIRFIPIISNLAVVPMLEGVAGEIDGRRAYLPPGHLWASRAYDGAVITPLPDMTFGIDLEPIAWRLATELGVSRDQLFAKGRLLRFRATTIAADPYPAMSARVDPMTLRAAALEGARFLLRHQEANGRFTYLYDSAKNRAREADRYPLPRHAGTAYFLAQVDRLVGMPEARAGALRALAWVKKNAMRRCGGQDKPCVGSDETPDVGSSALTALAASELLVRENTPWVRELMVGLTRFLRSMQRLDGELMHVYDVKRQRPIDVQRMYYSGEAAFALFRAHAAFQEPQALAAAKRLMKHLTGAGWSFFGSRYYYGEEHWTCQAAAEASKYMDVSQALDFCLRWTAYNRKMQYRDTSPWPIQGAYGVGPLLLPRLTPTASRTEAAISTYQMARKYGRDTADMREQIEAGLELLLRYRWAPGPSYLFFNPQAATGGVPGSPVDLTARNDFVQHAGSAMLLWADIKQMEHARQSPFDSGRIGVYK